MSPTVALCSRTDSLLVIRNHTHPSSNDPTMKATKQRVDRRTSGRHPDTGTESTTSDVVPIDLTARLSRERPTTTTT